MKILQICNYQYPHIGGIEEVAYDYAQIFNEMGIENKMICFNADAKDGSYITHQPETVHEVLDRIDLVRCGVLCKIFSQSISLSFPGELKRIITDFCPDLVIFHYPNPFMAFFLLTHSRKNFKLWILWHSDIINQKILGKLFDLQNKRLIKRAERIIGTSPRHLTEFDYVQYYANKGVVVPLMVDEEKLALSQDEIESAKKIKAKYQEKTIGFFLGRHVDYKGLEYLIKASKELDDTNVHFIIAGSGPLTLQLKELAKDDPKIEFVGRVSESEKRTYLQACDIFCFPSITRNEAFGIALAEGLYFGKPAVTFTIYGSGVNTVNLDGVTGIECENRNSHKYAEAIRTLCNDASLRERYGMQAHKHVIDNYTREHMKNALNDLLRENNA